MGDNPWADDVVRVLETGPQVTAELTPRSGRDDRQPLRVTGRADLE